MGTESGPRTRQKYHASAELRQDHHPRGTTTTERAPAALRDSRVQRRRRFHKPKHEPLYQAAQLSRVLRTERHRSLPAQRSRTNRFPAANPPPDLRQLRRLVRPPRHRGEAARRYPEAYRAMDDAGSEMQEVREDPYE